MTNVHPFKTQRWFSSAMSTTTRWYCLMAFIAFFGVLITSTHTTIAGQTIVVVLDDSGSMKARMPGGNSSLTRMEAGKQALTKVVAGLPDDTNLGILMLNRKTKGQHWLVPLGILSKDSTVKKIQSITPNGGTPLGSAMKLGADALLTMRQNSPYNIYRLLVVTDGEATDPQILSEFLPDLFSRGLTIDVIGVDMDGQHSLANLAHSYRTANDVASFEKALEEVFAESSNLGDDKDIQLQFAMLEGLDSDTAKTIISGLTLARNDPIQGFSGNVEEMGQPFQSGSNTAGNSGNNSPSKNSDNSVFGKFLFIVVVIVLWFLSTSRQGSRSNKKRR